MTYKELEKLAVEFFKGTPIKKSYAIAFDGTAFMSGRVSLVSREVYISFERRKVKFTFGAPLSKDSIREWRYETPEDLMKLLPKDEQDFDKMMRGDA